MNEHIYIDKEKPLCSLVTETLSDGSKGFNLVMGAKEIPCIDEKRGREAMAIIAQVIRKATNENVLHL